MIRVIENELDPAHIKKASCRNCAARLEYTMNDTQEKTHTDYTGDRETYRVIVCPKCGKDVEVRNA